MRKMILAAMMLATALPTVPLAAQRNPDRDYRDEVRDARKDYRNDLRDADSPQDVRDANREYRDSVRDARRDRRRDWRQYRNYSYNRYEPGQRGYYADQYYRDGSYYQPRRLSRNDRIYRGNDGRYYCRRSDGTTGLIIGGVAGGLLGNALSNGGNGVLGTLLGAAGGAALGSAVDRGSVQCR